MRVWLPSPLLSYTGGAEAVEAAGATLSEVMADLERRHPGLRFRVIDEQGRIRSTILFIVNEAVERDLERPVGPTDEIRIVAALSGG